MASSDYERAGATPDRHNYLPLLAINETELVNSLLSKGKKMPSGLSSVNLWVEWERILRLIKADVPAHSSAT